MNSFRTWKWFFFPKLFFFLINNFSFLRCKEIKINHNSEKQFQAYKNYCSSFRKILNGPPIEGILHLKGGYFFCPMIETDLATELSWWGWLCREVSSLGMTIERRGRSQDHHFHSSGTLGQWALSELRLWAGRKLNMFTTTLLKNLSKLIFSPKWYSVFNKITNSKGKYFVGFFFPN